MYFGIAYLGAKGTAVCKAVVESNYETSDGSAYDRQRTSGQ